MPDSNYDDFPEPEQSLESVPEAKNSTLQRPPAKQGLTPDVNLEDAFGQLFKSSVSGTGEEELLRIASDYALQIKARQFRLLQYLLHKASYFDLAAKYSKDARKLQLEYARDFLHAFVIKWLEYKKHNNSDVFVMRALDSISLRKFINENTLKVNIEK